MRRAAMFLVAGLAATFPMQAMAASDGPELTARFFNAIPDICFQTARGRPPTAGNADTLNLEAAPTLPPTVKAHFGRVPSWFRLKSQPDNVFVGVGDRPNACHVILANTTRTVEIHKSVIGFLKMAGFKVISENATLGSDIDTLFAMKAPDGYMLVSLQAPRSVIREGVGDQGGSCEPHADPDVRGDAAKALMFFPDRRRISKPLHCLKTLPIFWANLLRNA